MIVGVALKEFGVSFVEYLKGFETRKIPSQESQRMRL